MDATHVSPTETNASSLKPASVTPEVVKAASRVLLLAADVTQPDSYPVRFAEALAQEQHARLVLEHIVDPVLCMPLPADTAEAPQERQAAEAEIVELNKTAPAHIEDSLQRDKFFDAIVDSVHHHMPAVLLLGTQAQHEAARTILGGVARRLVLHCNCPVLVIGPPHPEQLAVVGRWRKILAATDFSSPSTAALLQAHRLATDELVALHCTTQENPESNLHWLEHLRFLAPFNESHTVPVQHIVEQGEPAGLIHALAEKLQPDLIVLGSPLFDLKDEDLISSTVCTVIGQAQCPVLLVPAVAAQTLDRPYDSDQVYA